MVLIAFMICNWRFSSCLWFFNHLSISVIDFNPYGQHLGNRVPIHLEHSQHLGRPTLQILIHLARGLLAAQVRLVRRLAVQCSVAQQPAFLEHRLPRHWLLPPQHLAPLLQRLAPLRHQLLVHLRHPHSVLRHLLHLVVSFSSFLFRNMLLDFKFLLIN